MPRIITISEDIKDEIARRVCEQAHPGYSTEYMGEYYVVDGTRVMHAQARRAWNPWPDSADIISVEDLVFIYGGAEESHCDFDPSPAEDIEGDTDADAWERAVAFALLLWLVLHAEPPPPPKLPRGFRLNEVAYDVRGLCAGCSPHAAGAARA